MAATSVFQAILKEYDNAGEAARFLKFRAYLAANHRKVARNDSRIQANRFSWSDLCREVDQLSELLAS